MLGHRVGLANTLFNTSSGNITIGDYTIFGYNVMVLTGRHKFAGGKRASLKSHNKNATDGWGGGEEEVPSVGYDIVIGQSCWIASGAIISGGVTIGDGVIVASNSVVTKDIPPYSIVAGVPGKVIGSTIEL